MLQKYEARKVLNCTNFLCTNFLKIFYNINFGTKYLKNSGKKNFELCQVFTHTFMYQNDKILIKIFKIYLVFIYSFLLQSVSELPVCIHTESITQ